MDLDVDDATAARVTAAFRGVAEIAKNSGPIPDGWCASAEFAAMANMSRSGADSYLRRLVDEGKAEMKPWRQGSGGVKNIFREVRD